MPFIAVITGLLLIGVGVGGFAAANFETKAMTALIPAVFGLLIGLCGILAFRQPRRRFALRAAAVVAFLGFLLPGGRLAMVLSKGEFAWNLGTSMLLLAALISLLFFSLCVRSSVKARRR